LVLQLDMDAEWQRLWNLKWTELDKRRAQAVKHALDVENIKRENEQKKLSKKEVLELHKRLEEQNRLQRLADLIKSRPDNFILVDTEKKLFQLCAALETERVVAVDCETAPQASGEGDPLDPWSGRMVGFSIGLDRSDTFYYVPFNHDSGKQLPQSVIFKAVKPYLESLQVVMHNSPFDCKWFLQYGVDITANLYFDTFIAAKVMNENDSHGLKELCERYLKIPGDNFITIFGNEQFNRVPLEAAVVYAAGDAQKTLKLYQFYMQHFTRLPKLQDLFFDIEMPVLKTMIRADYQGIIFDTDRAARLDRELGFEQERIEAQLRKYLGDINLNSTVQLAAKLYDELKIPDKSRGKRSTSTKVIKKLENRYEVIKLLIEYRTVAKLRQAFLHSLPTKVRAGGLIHPWHNSYGTATGRFSCSDPNTQQLPNKDARGRKIRQLFKANPGRILIGIDYSQIELRLLAHYCGDEAMLRGYREGIDIHAITASEVFGLTLEQILADEAAGCSLERKKAKNINFGIVYGITNIGLSNQIGCSEQEAQEFIDAYFKKFPGIKEFISRCHQMVTDKGYVESILYRKRRLLSLLRSGNAYEREKALRQAANFVIQASAADLLKKAIVDLQPVLDKWGVRIILQIHDELIFDAPENLPRQALTEIQQTMEHAIEMRVPVKVDTEIMPERLGEGIPADEWFERRAA